ncbi:MAG: o-succinylbenzoate synthase [Acidobacteria bacterium]|nr:o-succinylbenzoate synthase [Acidobacteriota bacterium]
MTIDHISLTHVRVPLGEPFRISSGAVSEKDAIVVEVGAEGLTGWGESSPMAGSFYGPDTPESCWRDLCESLAPGVIAGHPLDSLAGSNFAKTGIETALWDIRAQQQGVPLHTLLGGTAAEVDSGLAVGLYDDTADLLRAIERHMREGYKRVKIKIERGRDVELVRAVRREFGNIPLMTDANGDYTLEHADVFREMDEFGLLMFEQPLKGHMIAESAELQSMLRTPVCLDESLESIADVERAISLGALRIANIKIQRVGGFANALKVHALCRAAGLSIWVGTMPELGIGCAQGAALAALDGCNYPTDVESSLRWFTDDIVDPLITVHDGRIAMPTVPGLGYRVDPAKLDRYRVAVWEMP